MFERLGTTRAGLLVLTLLSAGLAGCVSEEASSSSRAEVCQRSDWVDYEDPEGTFELCHPDDWEHMADVMGAEVAFVPSEELGGDEFGSNLNVYSEALGQQMGSGEYVDAALPMLRKTITDFQLEARGPFTVGDVSGHEIVFEGRQGVYDLVWTQRIVVDDQTAYAITYTTEQTEDPVGPGTLDDLVATFTTS